MSREIRRVKYTMNVGTVSCTYVSREGDEHFESFVELFGRVESGANFLESIHETGLSEVMAPKFYKAVSRAKLLNLLALGASVGLVYILNNAKYTDLVESVGYITAVSASVFNLFGYHCSLFRLWL